MSKDEVKKKIYTEVSNECWKKLKILSVQKEISLSDHINEVLEKSVKKVNLLEENLN